MSTTTTSATGEPFTLPDRKALRVDFDMGSPSINWMLIAPDGRAWITSKPEELFAVLAPYHPLLKFEGSKT